MTPDNGPYTGPSTETSPGQSTTGLPTTGLPTTALDLDTPTSTTLDTATALVLDTLTTSTKLKVLDKIHTRLQD